MSKLEDKNRVKKPEAYSKLEREVVVDIYTYSYHQIKFILELADQKLISYTPDIRTADQIHRVLIYTRDNIESFLEVLKSLKLRSIKIRELGDERVE